MEKVYKLFKYNYVTYCQGSADRNVGYALLHVPNDASFSNNRSTLLNAKNREHQYEIDIGSIEDMTINF